MSRRKFNDRENTKHKINILLVVSIILLAVLIIGSLYLLIYLKSNSKTEPKVNSEANSNFVSVNGKYLFSGTIMLGRGVENYANGNYNQPFNQISSLGTYDSRIGVLECPVTTNPDSYQNEVNNLVFNCSPNWLPTLKKYYPILNLSSDHLNDQGQSGYAETVSRLNAAGFQTVGNYNPHVEKDDCKIIVLPVHLNKNNGQSQSSFLPIAICSYNYKIIFSPDPGEIQSIKKWSKILPVIALMNGGPEYEHQAGPAQVSYAHQMIDNGADFVVGNGTHWVQNTEVYKGKLIVYSMGNFIFDQLDYDGRIALNLSVGMNVKYDNNVGKWISVGSKCENNTSNCLQLANSMKLNRYTATYSFNAVGSYGGYLQVATKANAQQQSDIESRANWSQTIKQLTMQKK